MAAGNGSVGTWAEFDGGVAMLVRRAVRSRRAWTWLSVRGAIGELLDGLLRALTMSWMPARMRSVDEASGMVTLVGNQETVSQMRSRRVSQIQMV
jgi:hypothetical protein